jgi:mycofactocin precursor
MDSETLVADAAVETVPAAAPAAAPAAPAAPAAAAGAGPVLSDLLVEDVSIDGMCGVY